MCHQIRPLRSIPAVAAMPRIASIRPVVRSIRPPPPPAPHQRVLTFGPTGVHKKRCRGQSGPSIQLIFECTQRPASVGRISGITEIDLCVGGLPVFNALLRGRGRKRAMASIEKESIRIVFISRRFNAVEKSCAEHHPKPLRNHRSPRKRTPSIPGINRRHRRRGLLVKKKIRRNELLLPSAGGGIGKESMNPRHPRTRT